MAELPKISLAKALKLKNRLAGRLAKVQGYIQSYNVRDDRQEAKGNVPALVSEREQIMESLIALKTAIVKANSPFQHKIIRQGELRSKIDHLNSITTTDGIHRGSYGQPDITYVAAIKQTDIETQVRSLEKEIAAIQDELDETNYNVKIEVPQLWLDLAT